MGVAGLAQERRAAEADFAHSPFLYDSESDPASLPDAAEVPTSTMTVNWYRRTGPHEDDDDGDEI